MIPRRTFWALASVLVLAGVVLRFAHIGYGLPQVYNADEPHHVNVAVSFGRGSLDPGVFKYPTLWMYALFAAYGVYFLLWSGAGLLHSTAEFGQAFVRDPTAFYLIARVLAAAASLGGVWAVYVAGARGFGPGDRRRPLGLWAAALLTAAPTLIVSSHAAKPESLMFLLAAAAFLAALLGIEKGGRSLKACAVLVGLAASTQYNAAPLAVLIPAAWRARGVRHGGASYSELAVLCLLAGGGFLAGTPFALLNYPAFLRDLADHARLNALGEPAGAAAVFNAVRFCGQPFLGTVLLAAGAARLLSRDRNAAAVLLIPAACQVAFIAGAPEGTWERYLLAAYPAFALIGANGVEYLLDRLKKIPEGDPAVAAVLAAGLVFAGFAESWRFDRELGLPDTRALSAEWVLRHVPQGETVLLDQEHAGPRLRMAKGQAEELYARTSAAGHPRSRYYRLMVEGHPGGGYRIFRIAREYDDLHSGDWHVKWSSEGKDFLDLRAGLSAASAAGVRYVVLSSFGARPDRSPDLAVFFSELEATGELLREFKPVSGVVAGPRIRIFKLGADA